MLGRLALAFAATATVAAGAQIADARESKRVRVRSVSVVYSDLNLAQEADAQVMLRRLEDAARLACGRNPQMHPAHSLMPRYVNHIYQECREEAVAKAVATVNAPLLSQALHTATNRATALENRAGNREPG